MAVSLSVAGGFFLAAQRGSAPAPAARSTPHRRSRPLLHGGVLPLIGLHLGIGVFFGALQVSVTAFVVEHGQPGAAAPIFAVSSGSGLPAGWLYGLRRWRAAPAVHLLIATGDLIPATWLLLTSAHRFTSDAWWSSPAPRSHPLWRSSPSSPSRPSTPAS
ncbi:hypothetical protein AB0L66_21015 [Streptomyces sp. NPDC052207]|uniref:hypothetical protein n=1 Tax=Streptomyces sp. NPDC052207 TaxID=3155418 RepID=UPI00343A1B9B